LDVRETLVLIILAVMIALFAWLISHQPAVLFSHNKSATSNQPAVLFSQNKPAPAISHQPTEQAGYFL
jgi:flagellar basal body-associated protein FliL